MKYYFVVRSKKPREKDYIEETFWFNSAKERMSGMYKILKAYQIGKEIITYIKTYER